MEMSANKHEPANFELLELYHRDVQSLNRLAQLNFNTKAMILRKKSEIVGKIFLQLWKSNFDDFLQIIDRYSTTARRI